MYRKVARVTDRPPIEEDDSDQDGEDCEGGGFKLDEARIRTKGKILTKTKDKTDSTITNKQDPQDTPGGQRIFEIVHDM